MHRDFFDAVRQRFEGVREFAHTRMIYAPSARRQARQEGSRDLTAEGAEDAENTRSGCESYDIIFSGARFRSLCAEGWFDAVC